MTSDSVGNMLDESRSVFRSVVAWFAVCSTTLSQLLRMRVMASPFIFYLSKKYN